MVDRAITGGLGDGTPPPSLPFLGPVKRPFLFALLAPTAMVASLLLSGPAGAHPGRLDSEGCHKVRNDYEHRSGKVDKAGTEHCHRSKKGLGLGVPMDGREQLADPNHPDEDSPRDNPEPDSRGGSR